ncbi:MAG: winged helix-turn-helix transcriptional regulator [Anaerolineae bacterium]|nr:winged helix-turn-helix transcriptional regulator [Anaerolineae bacterium]
MELHQTRQKIIEYLKEKEQATVDELADVVSLTPMAVRYHLNVLQKDNLITAPAVRRPKGRGRPQQVYALTEAADDLFPVDYFGLTDYLLDELSMQLGDEGIYQIFCRIADRLAGEAPPARHNQTIAERLDEVVTFLQGKGFVVEWEMEGNNYVIHAHSCPYRQVAKDHEEVCLLDKRIISFMLNTEPVRTSCLSSGNTYCTYQISEPIQLIVEPS